MHIRGGKQVSIKTYSADQSRNTRGMPIAESCPVAGGSGPFKTVGTPQTVAKTFETKQWRSPDMHLSVAQAAVHVYKRRFCPVCRAGRADGSLLLDTKRAIQELRGPPGRGGGLAR